VNEKYYLSQGKLNGSIDEDSGGLMRDIHLYCPDQREQCALQIFLDAGLLLSLMMLKFLKILHGPQKS